MSAPYELQTLEGVLVWTTKDGRRVPVTEMANGHLKNAHAFALRNAASWSWGDKRAGFRHAAEVFAAEMRRRGWSDQLDHDPLAGIEDAEIVEGEDIR